MNWWEKMSRKILRDTKHKWAQMGCCGVFHCRIVCTSMGCLIAG